MLVLLFRQQTVETLVGSGNKGDVSEALAVNLVMTFVAEVMCRLKDSST